MTKCHPSSKLVGLLALIAAVQPAPAQSQTADSLHLAGWRKSAEFAYIRQYFPSRKIEFDLQKQMNPNEIKSTTTALSRALTERATVARTNLQAIRILLTGKTAKVPGMLPGTLKVEVRDDGQVWFQNAPPGTVIVGPRTIRGLMKGSLQSLRVELPRNPLDWDNGMPAPSFFGSDLLGKDNATITDSEWDTRFAKLMNTIEKSKIKSMLGTVWRAMSDNDDDLDDDSFDFDEADDYISGKKKMSLFVSMELGGAMLDFSKHYLAAERFMLAHELGHLALANNPTANSSCQDAQKAEDEADAFAVALLMMDDATGTVVIAADTSVTDAESTGFFQNFDIRGGMGLGSDDYSVVYGYRDFTNFVFKAAEFSGQITATCSYRTPTDRQTYIDGLRQELYQRRKDAFGVILNYYKKHPPVLSMQVSGAGNTADQIYADLDADRQCPGVAQKRGSRRVMMKSLSGFGASSDVRGTEYYIKCAWPQPQPSLLTPDELVLVGPNAWNGFLRAYAG